MPALRPARLAACLLLLLVGTAPAQTPPPKAEWVLAGDLEPKLAQPTPWLSLLERASLSAGRYRLAAGASDGQQPHDRDEVYFVLAGSAQCTVADTTRDVTAGDLVFVAAATPHRFHDITADLDLLVFFSAAAPATGGMIEGPKPTEQTPYPETSARGATRIFYWFGPDSAGQVAIDHGRPRWNPAYDKFLTEPSSRRWRFGENFWTTLDTNMALTIAGVEVPVGMYYVVLQHAQDRGIELVLLDPQEVRRQRLDAYEAAKTTGGIAIPLRREAAAFPAARLAVQLSVDRGQRDRGQLAVHFGPHRLVADVALQPYRPK